MLRKLLKFSTVCSLLAINLGLLLFCGFELNISGGPVGPSIAIVGITDATVAAANTRLIGNGGGLMIIYNAQTVGTNCSPAPCDSTQEIGSLNNPVAILGLPSGSITYGQTDGSRGMCFNDSSGIIGLSTFTSVNTHFRIIFNGATLLDGESQCIKDGSQQGWYEVGVDHVGTGGTVNNAMTDIWGFSGSYFLWETWRGGNGSIARLVTSPCNSATAITPTSVVRNSATDATVNVATGTFSYPDATCISTVPTASSRMQVTLANCTGDTTFNGTFVVTQHSTAGSFHIATVGTSSSPSNCTYLPKSHTGGNNNAVASVMLFMDNVFGLNHVAGTIPSVIAPACTSGAGAQVGDLWFFAEDLEGAGTGQYNRIWTTNGCGLNTLSNIISIGNHMEAVSDATVNGLNINGCYTCAVMFESAASSGGTVINIANTTDNVGILIWGIRSNWTNQLVDNVNTRTYAQGTTAGLYDHIGFYLLRSGIEGDLYVYGANGGGGKNGNFERLELTCQGTYAPDCTLQQHSGGSGTVRNIILAGFSTSSQVALGQNGSKKVILDTDSNLRFSGTAPTISSGFGTTPSITANSTNNMFQVNVGTGGSATTGIVAFAGTWTHTPFCIAGDTQTTVRTFVTSPSTTLVTLTGTAAWPASTLVNVECH